MKKRLQYAMPRVSLKKLKKISDAEREEHSDGMEDVEAQFEDPLLTGMGATNSEDTDSETMAPSEGHGEADCNSYTTDPEYADDDQHSMSDTSIPQNVGTYNRPRQTFVVHAEVHQPGPNQECQEEGGGYLAESVENSSVEAGPERYNDEGGSEQEDKPVFCGVGTKVKTHPSVHKTKTNFRSYVTKSNKDNPRKEGLGKQFRKRGVSVCRGDMNTGVKWGFDESSESDGGWEQGDIPLLPM